MSIKQILQRILPQTAKSKIQQTCDVVTGSKAAKKQYSRFIRWISLDSSKDSIRIETRLEFDIHRLEKGLSHTQFRHGFGKSVIAAISKRMLQLEKVTSNYMQNNLYLNGLAVLHEYQERHIADSYNLSEIQKLVDPAIWEKAKEYSCDKTHAAGSFILHASTKKENLNRNFIQLAENRYSVREYLAESVSQELLENVYGVSMKTPSVCNRQATRIHEITNPEIIRKALKIQGGFNGYPIPPVLLFITSDIRAFMNSGERNEPFVDGGLFSMSLLYALEAYGLAACPLNAMFNLKQDRATRQLLHIPDYELPIMYIAVGHFPESVPVCVCPCMCLDPKSTTRYRYNHSLTRWRKNILQARRMVQEPCAL